MASSTNWFVNKVFGLIAKVFSTRLRAVELL